VPFDLFPAAPAAYNLSVAITPIWSDGHSHVPSLSRCGRSAMTNAGVKVSGSLKPVSLQSRRGFRQAPVLGAVGPARVLCTLQVELKHFAALDTVILPKMHVHVINRDGPAADGEAFARFIPPQRDWAFECFVHKPDA
jgi:hypothetical protein